MPDDEFYQHAKKVVYGYRKAGFFERAICMFWYLACQRWDWIFHGGARRKNRA